MGMGMVTSVYIRMRMRFLLCFLCFSFFGTLASRKEGMSMIVFCRVDPMSATNKCGDPPEVHQTFESSCTSRMNELEPSRCILMLSPEEACMVPEVSKKSW